MNPHGALCSLMAAGCVDVHVRASIAKRHRGFDALEVRGARVIYVIVYEAGK